jgi:hypothetical protein
MTKASLIVSSASPSSEPAAQVAREQMEVRRGWQLVLGAGLFLALATLFVTFAIRVGTHLVTAWWLESLRCTVEWKIDGTNWKQLGETSVSYDSRNRFDSDFKDQDLDHLSRLFCVAKLDLAECDTITNLGLAKLRGLDFLAELNLARLYRYRYARYGSVSSPLTDACVINLRPLRRLEKLSLAGNLITDAGLSQIATMTNLKSLDLEATDISDAGLVHLMGMKNLKEVHLGGTRVTSAGLTELQMARPDLTIEFDVEPTIEEGLKLRREQFQ